MYMKVFLLTLALSYVKTHYLDCGDLFQPMLDGYKVTGKWIVHAVASSSKRMLDLNQGHNSTWFNISETGIEREVHREDNINGTCDVIKGTLKILEDEIKFYFDRKPYPVQQTGRFYQVLNSSAIVFKGNIEWLTSPKVELGTILVLLAQTSDVSAKTMAQYNRMARCSNMGENTVYLETTAICDASED
ncbi:hypothetical protein NL108_007985 [Boleophthalmus pectinirostris]|nr:hypothetical protein NL108_007985 [Boleophthalmus pectinirostris]